MDAARTEVMRSRLERVERVHYSIELGEVEMRERTERRVALL